MNKASRPTVYTIPPGYNFSYSLAETIHKQHGPAPQSLSKITLFVPNRRAVQAIQNSFLQVANGAPIILPALRPIGDVEEDEGLIYQEVGGFIQDLDIKNSISTIDRRLLLMKQILAAAPGLGFGNITAAEALKLADELSRLLDQMHIEGVDPSRLNDLVPDDFAEHWQATLKFLSIILEFWPQIKSQWDVIDPAERQKQRIEQLTKSLAQSNTKDAIIAAGSTGTMPATADLLSTICRLENGAVVLPAYDPELSDEVWKHLDETHPQFAFKRLFERMRLHRDDVEYWPHMPVLDDGRKKRVSLFRTALWPAASVPDWQELHSSQSPARFAEDSLNGLSIIECSDIREEAGVIALALRQALETKNKSAALITANRELAQRVTSELTRWGIQVDDSAGTPLAKTRPAGLIRLLLKAVEDNFAPLSLLSLLKHPLCFLARERGEVLTLTRRLEERILRGPRSYHSLDELIKSVTSIDTGNEIKNLLETLAHATSRLRQKMSAKTLSLQDVLKTLIDCVTAITTPKKEQDAHIWNGVEGEALSKFFLETFDCNVSDLSVKSDEFSNFFEGLLLTKTVRKPYGGHPRLAIWGTLESRMQVCDLMIIGGLNEGSWPPQAADDPWMSRPMRDTLKLPSDKFRVGLSAHDFFGALSAKETIMTRALKIDGAPSVPSRWLLRLKALMQVDVSAKHPLKEWFHLLDKPDAIKGAEPPQPKPPLNSRPNALSVTAIQRLIEDPYSLYAQRILKLNPLEKIDEDPQAMTRGNIIHTALEYFLKDKMDRPIVPEDIHDLMACGKKAFDECLKKSPVRAFWWPRFEQIAEAFINEQISRQHAIIPVAIEQKGKLEIAVDGVPFTLSCKADRIDHIKTDDHYAIIDYKTGAPPSTKRVQAGYAPQMPLEAVILEGGGFENIHGKVGDFQYWQVSGGDTPLKATSLKVNVQEEIKKAHENLLRLIRCFNDAKTPYLSKPNPIPDYMGYGEYDHLARVKEWIGNERKGVKNG